MKKLKVGDPAPEISGTDQNGKTRSIKEFQGRKLIIYFYPKDMTPGCTVESCNLRDNFKTLQNEGFEVLGVSKDEVKRHVKFIEKYDLPFDLIADTDQKMIDAYGVWGPKQFMGKKFDGILRTTFVINENGIIDLIIDKVKTKSHSEQIMEAFSTT